MLFYQQFYINFKQVYPIQIISCNCKSTGISKLRTGAFFNIIGRKLKKATAPQGAFIH